MPIGKRVLIKTHKAKQEYKCDLCGDIIEKGEHYYLASAQHKGRFIRRIYCITTAWAHIHEHIRAYRNQLDRENNET